MERVSTVLTDTNIYGGTYLEDRVPLNKTTVNILYTGGLVYPILVDGVWVEGLTQAEIAERNQNRAIEIDLEYTEKIGKLLTKHQNKKTRAEQQGQIYVIPQITLDEAEALEQECNQRILEETGITTYTYRQSNPILAKGTII